MCSLKQSNKHFLPYEAIKNCKKKAAFEKLSITKT